MQEVLPAGDEGTPTSRLPAQRQELLRAGLQEVCRQQAFPACALAVASSSGVLHATAAGLAGEEASEAVSPVSTVFGCASISKTVVALLCLQCAEHGEMDLDADIGEYLPFTWPFRNPNFPEVNVTARQLLTHSSSLCDDESALYPGSLWRTEDQDCPKTLAEYAERRFSPESEAFESYLWSRTSAPGQARWQYSNAGFSILGLALETVTTTGAGGVDTLAQERLFKPLGMRRTSFFLARLRALPKDDVSLELAKPDGRAHYGVCEYPAASLRSTAMDLGRYLSALLTGLDREEGVLGVLSRSSLLQMLPPGEQCQGGLAWWGKDAGYGSKAGKTWEHGGFMPGIRSHIYLWPKAKVGAVVLANGEGSYTRIQMEMKAALAEHLAIPLKEL